MVYSILHILLLSRMMPPFWPGSVVVNDYATRKKKKLGHAVEYGLIFHGKFQEKNIHVILFSELTFAIRTVGSGRQLLKLWPC